MRSRLNKAVAAVTLVAALAVGGATFASAASKSPSKAPAPATAVVDTDTVQQGDQSAPDKPGAADESPSASESASEPAGESGSEVPGNDGPGGHADEPGNPNADHQFQGAE
jgi:hypothetical protein